MKKNKQMDERSNSSRRSEEERKRNTIILILAILFFLFGLWMLAKANGFDFLKALGMPTNTGMYGTNNNGQTGQPGQPGRAGQPGTAGGQGTGGGNGGTGTGTGPGTGGGTGATKQGLDINAKTDTGVGVDAGINDQGQVYVSPQLNPNAQGGVGGEVNINKDKVIDTHNLLN